MKLLITDDTDIRDNSYVLDTNSIPLNIIQCFSAENITQIINLDERLILKEIKWTGNLDNRNLPEIHNFKLIWQELEEDLGYENDIDSENLIQTKYNKEISALNKKIEFLAMRFEDLEQKGGKI